MSNYDLDKLIQLILLSLSSFYSLILLITFIKYKNKKSKQEILIIERLSIIILFNLFLIVCSILSLFNLNLSSIIKQSIFITTLVYYYSNIFCCYLEQYKRIFNPFYFFFSIINSKKKNILWELSSVCAIGVSLVLFYQIPSDYQSLYPKETDFNLITLNIGVISLGMLISVVSLYLIIASMIQLSNFLNPSKKPIKKKCFVDLCRMILMTIFICAKFVFWIYKSVYDSQIGDYLTPFSYAFLVMIFLDGIFEMISISISDFFYYKLGKKNIGCFYSFFGLISHFTPPMFINENALEPKKEHVLYYFQNNLGLDLSQFNIEAAEYYINTSLASISMIYNSMQSGKVIDYSKEGEETDPKINPLLWQTQDKFHYHKYNFNKKSFQEDKNSLLTNLASNFLDKSAGTYRNNISIEIKSFYPKEMMKIIETHKVDLTTIKASLLSHAFKFPFLICRNSTENFFNFLKTFSLKTCDKKLNIEIFEDVLNEERPNQTIEQYLNHLIKRNSTFLQVVIGIFKININSSRPFFVFLSKNSILETVPRNMFNYWQLMRYSGNDQVEIISCSKDRTSFCVTNENIFNGLKIEVSNYNSLSKTLKEDINLLCALGSKMFSVLVMYYEFEANRKSNMFDAQLSIENQTNSLYRISDIKHMLYQEDISSMTDININFDLSKTKREANGYDAGVNGMKCMLFFTFERVFEFRGITLKSIDYNQFYDGFMGNFEESKFGESIQS